MFRTQPDDSNNLKIILRRLVLWSWVLFFAETLRSSVSQLY